MASTFVYKVIGGNDAINHLGENGWYIFCKNPLIVAIDFEMPEGAPILEQFKQWVSHLANKNGKKGKEYKWLTSHGYKFREVHSDSSLNPVFVLEDDCQALRQWRLEFSYDEDSDAIRTAYITFGSPEMDTPAFLDKAVIDKYVPKAIISDALRCGALDEAEIDEAGFEVTPDEG